ncbi:hypothetical protein C8A03DRAFT_35943 [Achaetomium macrosporum]|uniref:Uncharacterized protein n=1 Tax=Achaetomium macrosporum TaxID=79813 RepID=A0AAN7C697_9PEZI|nr:hypothetical protein C8A03DRAFT_35943 [Achaetomium macrosporum]
MDETHWDPGNLLQITEPDREFEIQCVGRAVSKFNARCRWTKSGDDAAAIRSRVRQLAANPPSEATQQDLESLARLCVCEGFHSNQWLQVARRWKSVVATAVQHHEKLVAKTSSIVDKAQPEKLLLERQKCLEILGAQVNERDLVGKLTAYVSHNQSEKRENEAKLVQLQSELARSLLRELKQSFNEAKLREAALTEKYCVELNQLGQTAITEISRVGELAGMTARAEFTRLGEEFSMYMVRLLKETEEHWEGRLAKEVEESSAVTRLLEEERLKSRGLEEAKAVLEHQLSEARTRNDHQLDEEKDKTRRVEEANKYLEARFSEANAEAQRLLEEVKAKATMLLEAQEESKRQLSAADTRADKSAAEANKANRDNETLAQENTKILEQLRRLEVDMATSRAEIRHLQDHRVNLERELQQSQADAQALRSTNSQLITETAALRAPLQNHAAPPPRLDAQAISSFPPLFIP